MSYLHKTSPLSSYIRSWPFPYRAGMTISNDAEFMDFEFFETFMAYVNGKGQTPLGNGLGLNITSSAFFYSAHPYNFSYFDGIDAHSPISKQAERVRDYIRTGWIDTIHAYGDFDGVGGFIRQHALNIFNELKRHNLVLKAFTNHGGVENWQNVGSDATYHRGDLHGHEAYHADLMKSHGVKYVWTDSMITAKPSNKQKAKSLIKSILHLARKSPPSIKKELIFEVQLQDGSSFKGFHRFRSTGQNAPNLSSLMHQLNQIDWNYLYKKNLCVVIYQHLGVLYRNNGKCTAATIDNLARNHAYLNGFKRLKSEYDSGRLWLAGTVEFLDYVDMVQSTLVRVEGNKIHLHNDKCKGNPDTFFQGLTIYVEELQNIILTWENIEIAYVINSPDKTGKVSITIPPIQKEDIWA